MPSPVAFVRGAGRALAALGLERPAVRHVGHYSHLTPTIVRHLNGAVEAMFEVRGAAWQDLGPLDLVARHDALCGLHLDLNRIPRLTLYVLLVRTEAEPGDYPLDPLPTPFVAEMDRRYRRRLLDEGRLYRNALYLSVVIQPPRGETVERAALAPVDRAEVEALEGALGTIRADLGPTYGLRPLGLREASGGRLYSEPAEAWHLALTGRRRAVPLPAGRLGHAILPHRVVFGRDGVVELRGHAGAPDAVAALYGYSVYPHASDAPMFDPMLSAPCRFTLAQSFGTIALDAAQRTVAKQANALLTAADPAAEQVAELRQAASALQQRLYGFGPHSITLCVFADDRAGLRAAGERMDGHMREAGAIVSRIDWDAEAAYFGMLSGAHGLACRAAPIKTRNFAAHAPLRAYPSGWRGGRWCDAAAVLTSEGGTPIYWNPHVAVGGGPGEVPHARFTGSTRSGKTTAMLALLAWLRDRAGAQVVLWGKDLSAKLFTIAMEGEHFEFANGEPTGIAPLRALDGRRPGHLDHLVQLWRSLILLDGGPALLPETDRRLALATRLVMRMPAHRRSLGEVCAFLGDGEDNASARLRPWCRGEPLGWVLDGEEDRIRLDAGVVAFDQTHYLKHPKASGPLQAHLFFRVGQLADGRRLVVALDEVQESFRHPASREMIANGLATFAKKNVAMWLATQSPGTLLAVPDIAHIVREQCLTTFDFANPNAVWADHETLGYPRRAYDIITRELASGEKGRFLLGQGGAYVPAQLSFEGMDDVLAVLSGHEETCRLFDRVRADLGPDADQEDVFAEWHRRRKSPVFQRAFRRAEARRDLALREKEPA